MNNLTEQEQKRIDRWMTDEATEDRKEFFRAYNALLNLSARLQRVTKDSSFLTEDEKLVLDPMAKELFWVGISFSGVLPGMVEAAVESI